MPRQPPRPHRGMHDDRARFHCHATRLDAAGGPTFSRLDPAAWLDAARLDRAARPDTSGLDPTSRRYATSSAAPPAAGPAGPYGSPEPAPRPPLRRSNTNRVLAGVSGGLGEYFGVDPVLFRVLFATSAFFGGVGIIAYLVAWAVIPERGAPSAPLDGVARWMRQRRVPFGVAIAAAAIVAWVVLFSWWRPWPFFPLLIVAILLVVVLERNRNRRLAAHGAAPSRRSLRRTCPDEQLADGLSVCQPPSRSRRDRTDPSLSTSASDRRADRVQCLDVRVPQRSRAAPHREPADAPGGVERADPGLAGPRHRGRGSRDRHSDLLVGRRRHRDRRADRRRGDPPPGVGLLGHSGPGVPADLRAGRDVGQPPRRIR